jgi:hypothetical protein
MPAISCAWCGRSADDPPLTWTLQTGDRGVEWLCEQCTRSNVRSVEARLPAEWW